MEYASKNPSLRSSSELQIDKTTRYFRTSTVRADAEFYFYGKITNAGGKDRVNIHINTEDLGIIRIDTPQSVLENLKENILYKSFGVRASGKQNTEIGEIDKGSLRDFGYLSVFTQNYPCPERVQSITLGNTG